MIWGVFGRFCCVLILFSVRFLAPAPPQHSRAVPQLRLSMARASNLLVSAVLFAGAFTVSRWAFVAPNVNTQGLRQSSTALAARGGGEYDISDADIQNFYNSLLTLGRCTCTILDPSCTVLGCSIPWKL